MIKNFLNSSALMIIRMDFAISTMKRKGDRTETTQKGTGSSAGSVTRETSAPGILHAGHIHGIILRYLKRK